MLQSLHRRAPLAHAARRAFSSTGGTACAAAFLAVGAGAVCAGPRASAVLEQSQGSIIVILKAA